MKKKENSMKKEYDLSKMKTRKARIYTKEEIENAEIKVGISLRLDLHILKALKEEAARLGMPYQTLVNSILHRFVTGELIDKKTISKKTGS